MSSVTEPGHVRLDVVDVLGRVVEVLVDASRPSGTHTAVFDGRTLPRGLSAAWGTDTRALVLLR